MLVPVQWLYWKKAIVTISAERCCNWSTFIGDVYNFSYFSWGIVGKNIISNIMFFYCVILIGMCKL